MGVHEHAVVVVGGGPTGLMLAAELALQDIDVAVLEQRPDQDLAGSRAGGLHARSLEVLDQRGIVDRFLAEGQVAQVAGFSMVRLDIGDFPTRHNYGLGLWQNHIERILAEWVREMGVAVRYDSDFPGFDPTVSSLIAEVEMAHEPEFGVRRDDLGLHALGRAEYEIRDGEVVFADTGTVRVMVTEPEVRTAEPTLRDVSEALVTVYGTDFGAHAPTWISRFTDTSRQAASYRAGCVLLAGDAAHVHAPDGGQGLNTGLQDAVNLGWKLAQVAKGSSPEILLDTYHAERHPVAARVLRTTMAQVALLRPDDRTKALLEVMTELLGVEEARRRFAGMQSGLDIHYDLGEGHPLLGRRVPDLDLVTADGPRRAYSLLHGARPVLLDLGDDSSLDTAGRVRKVDATYDGPWELPILGEVTAPTAVLIRPDGHVAWVGEGTDAGLDDALTTWFGPPTRA